MSLLFFNFCLRHSIQFVLFYSLIKIKNKNEAEIRENFRTNRLNLNFTVFYKQKCITLEVLRLIFQHKIVIKLANSPCDKRHLK